MCPWLILRLGSTQTVLVLAPTPFEISVDVGTGGGNGCVHEDNGENVDYVIELIALEYTVVEIKE